MRGLRSILSDRSSASAVLALAILLLLLQTVVSSAMSVAASVGERPVFVICAPLSPGGILEVAAEHEPSANYHCPLCRVASVSVLPVAIDDLDLGPAFVLERIEHQCVAAEDAPAPPLLTTVLAPDRTGPPAGRL